MITFSLVSSTHVILAEKAPFQSALSQDQMERDTTSCILQTGVDWPLLWKRLCSDNAKLIEE
jgi:hypothetical protein